MKKIVLCKSGIYTDYYGNNESVKEVANIIGKSWKGEEPGLRAFTTLGIFPDEIQKSIRKLENAGYRVVNNG